MKELSELDVHEAFINNPTFLAQHLGIQIKGELTHHYRVSGKEIDFVVEDISERHWIIEVKLRDDPISCVGQVIRYEKLYQKKHPDLSDANIVPVLLIDNESFSKEDQISLKQHGVRLIAYDLSEIEKQLITLDKEGPYYPAEINFDKLSQLAPAAKDVQSILEDFMDIRIVLEGVRAHFTSRDFWRWKQNEPLYWWPETIFELQKTNRHEDALWVTFLEAATDEYDVAEAIFQDGWDWEQINSITKKKFVKYLNETPYRLTKIIRDKGGLTKGEILVNTVFDYLSLVEKSQEEFFYSIIQESDSQYEAYDDIVEALKDNIAGVGPWVARAFATWVSNRKLLPITSTDKVRISRPIREIIKELGLTDKKPSKRKSEQIILNIAAKYRVAPEFIMRGLFTMGYRYSDLESSE